MSARRRCRRMVFRSCNRISAIEMQPEFAYESKAKEIMDNEKSIQFPKDGFKDSSADGELYSVEEMVFKEILESGTRRCDKGHYEMPLPPKSAKPNLSFNKPLPLKRWKQLPGRLRKNPKFGGDYRACMDDVIRIMHREYLEQLQPCQKWTRMQRDLAISDVVIVKETADVQWPLARVAEDFLVKTDALER